MKPSSCPHGRRRSSAAVGRLERVSVLLRPWAEKRAHIHTYKTHSYPLSHAHSHIGTHTLMHTYALTHTYTQTHSYTQSECSFLSYQNKTLSADAQLNRVIFLLLLLAIPIVISISSSYCGKFPICLFLLV